MTIAGAPHWVCVDQTRFVHMRVQGAGPPAILLHGSPQSARAVQGMMHACAQAGLTAIALDTPGNGLSDPLAIDTPSIEDYAHALHETLTAIGVTRAALYGFHTGAAIALAFANSHPEMVSALVLDGCPIWTPAERSDLLARYLPPLVPTWDGGHLAWVWSRIEEQAIFFPWYETTSSACMADGAVASPAIAHANAMDFLRAADAYRGPYAAAFRFAAGPMLARLRPPTWLTAHPTDPLAIHLQRVETGARVHLLESASNREAMHAQIAQKMRMHAQGATPHSWPQAVDHRGHARGYVTTPQGDISFRGPLHADSPLFLHDAGQSAARAPQGSLALDLPGHGPAGDSWAHIPTTPSEIAEAMRQPMRALGLSPARLHGEGLGAAVAAALTGKKIVLDDAAAPPDLTPRWDGAHLFTAWRYLRRSAMFLRWDQPQNTAVKSGEPNLDPNAITAALIDLFDCGAHLPAAFAARKAAQSSAK